MFTLTMVQMITVMVMLPPLFSAGKNYFNVFNTSLSVFNIAYNLMFSESEPFPFISHTVFISYVSTILFSSNYH